VASLKITKKNLPVVLFDGESIEVSLSLEAKIDGEAAWIGYKVFGRLQESETADALHSRVKNVLRHGITDMTGEAVEIARELSE